MQGVRSIAAAIGTAAALTLAGCAETELVINSSKVVTKPETPTRPAYKVGQPYQVAGVWYYPKVDYNYDETGIASWYGPDFNGKPTASGEIYDQNGLTAAHKTLPLPTVVQVTNLENGRSLKLRINDRGPFVNGRIIDVSRRAAQLLGFHDNGTARVRVKVLAEESMTLAAALTGGVPTDEPQPPAPSAAPTMAVTSQPLGGTTAAAPPPSAAPSGATATTASSAGSTSSLQLAAASAQPDGRVYQSPVKPTSIFIQAGAFTQRQNAERLRAELARLGAATMTPITVGNQQFYRVRLGPIVSVPEADRLLDQLVRSGHPEARIVVD
jgi:rare lipoprotein A